MPPDPFCCHYERRAQIRGAGPLGLQRPNSWEKTLIPPTFLQRGQDHRCPSSFSQVLSFLELRPRDVDSKNVFLRCLHSGQHPGEAEGGGLCVHKMIK